MIGHGHWKATKQWTVAGICLSSPDSPASKAVSASDTRRFGVTLERKNGSGLKRVSASKTSDAHGPRQFSPAAGAVRLTQREAGKCRHAFVGNRLTPLAPHLGAVACHGFPANALQTEQAPHGFRHAELLPKRSLEYAKGFSFGPLMLEGKQTANLVQQRLLPSQQQPVVRWTIQVFTPTLWH